MTVSEASTRTRIGTLGGGGNARSGQGSPWAFHARPGVVKVLKGHSAARRPGPESCPPGSLAVWPWVSDSISLVSALPLYSREENGSTCWGGCVGLRRGMRGVQGGSISSGQMLGGYCCFSSCCEVQGQDVRAFGASPSSPTTGLSSHWLCLVFQRSDHPLGFLLPKLSSGGRSEKENHHHHHIGITQIVLNLC